MANERSPCESRLTPLPRVYGVPQGPMKGGKSRADATLELEGRKNVDIPARGESSKSLSNLEGGPVSLGQKPMPQKQSQAEAVAGGNLSKSGDLEGTSGVDGLCLESQDDLFAAPSEPVSHPETKSTFSFESDMDLEAQVVKKRLGSERNLRQAKKKPK